MKRGRTILIALALVAINLVVYAPVRHFDFQQLDDPLYITENADVLRGLTPEGIVWAFTTGRAANWHPLTWLSHMLDVQLFGVAAGPHHLVSVLLHIANTLLVFGLFVQLTGAVWRSAFVAALFAVHPLHVESVAWVAERKDVLSTLLGLLAIWAYAGFVRAQAPKGVPPPSASRRFQHGFYALVLAFFALGLMAKPMLVTLPFVLLLLDVWPLRRLSLAAPEVRNPKAGDRRSGRAAAAGSPRADAAVRRSKNRSARARGGREAGLLTKAWPLVREKLPLFAMAVASGIVTITVQQRGGAVSALEAIPFGLRLQNALVSLVAYLGNTFWPAGLTLYPLPESIPAWQTAGALVVLGGISFVVYRLARSHPYLPVGWLWYLGMLIPVVGLVQVGLQARADRYTYVPLIGIFIMIAWGAAALLDRLQVGRIVGPVAATVVILGCTVAARTQVGYWKDSVTFWTRATMLSMNVDEYDAHMSLGTTLGNQGRLDEAAAHFADAVRLRPQSDAAHCSLGIALARLGRAGDAAREFNEALRLNPANQAARQGIEGLPRRDRP